MSWDDPGLLQHVGLGVDRFGEVDPIIEPGEVDQEQHDAVATCSSCRRRACSCAPTCSARSAGSTRRISFHGDDVDLCWRAHLSGARVVVAPQARVRHREELDGAPPRSAPRRAAGPAPDAHGRHADGGGRLPLRSLELVLLTIAELFVGLFTGRLGEAWSSLRALVGLIPRTPALLARRRRDRPSCAASTTPRSSACRTAAAPADLATAGPTTPRRTSAPTPTVRRWRESQLEHDVRLGRSSSSFVIVASRTMIDSSVPVRRRVPAAAGQRRATGGRTSRRRGAPAGSARRPRTRPAGACCRSPACCGCAGWARADRDRRRARAARRVGHVAAGDGVPVEPGPHRRARRLRGDAARAGRDLDRAAVGASSPTPSCRGSCTCCASPPASARPTRRPRRTTSSTACSTCAPASASGAPRVLTLATAVAVALAPAVLPVLAVVAVVLGADDARRQRRRADAGVADGARARRVRGGVRAQPAVVDDVVVGRPRRAVARRRPGPRPRRRGVDGDRPRPLRGARPGALRPGPRRPARRPGMAADVGRPRRRPGRRVPRPGVLQDRDALPFRVPEIGILLAPGRPRPGARPRHRPSPRSARTSPAARSGGASRSACSAIAAVVRRRRAGAVRRHRRRLVRAALDADRGRRAPLPADRLVPTAPAGRRLPRPVPRRPPVDPVPVRRPRRRRRDGARRRRCRRPPRPLGGRRPGRPTTPCARSSRQIAVAAPAAPDACSRRSASASSSSRSSTARRRRRRSRCRCRTACSMPSAPSSTSSARTRRRPTSASRTAPCIPTTASLTGDARRRVDGDVGRGASSASMTADGHARVRRRRRDPRRDRRRPAGVVTWRRRRRRLGARPSAVQAAGPRRVRRGDGLRRRGRRGRALRYAQPTSRTVWLVVQGVLWVLPLRRRQPAVGADPPADAPAPTRR